MPVPATGPRRLPHPAKALIIGQGRTIKEVASAVGVNDHSLGRILNGYAAPWPSLVDRLAAELGASREELFR